MTAGTSRRTPRRAAGAALAATGALLVIGFGAVHASAGRHADFAFDRLDVNTLDGDDSVTSLLPRGIIQLFVDGNPV